MPTYKFILAGVFGLVLLSGCLEITTTNDVKPDGSVVRTITLSGDSAEVFAGKFPVTLDTLWKSSIAKEKEQRYTLTVTRTFRDEHEMNAAVGGVFGRTLQYRIRVEKSFQWFFTVYRYEETVLPFAQFTSIPLSQSFTESEIEWFKSKILIDNPEKGLKTREDSVTLEKLSPRGEEWERRNRFEAVFSAFLSGVKIINDASLPAYKVEAEKEALFRRSEDPIGNGKIDTLRLIFKSVLKNTAVEEAWVAGRSALEEVRKKMEFEGAANSHKYVTNVAMPGIITATNAGKLEANIASWQDYKDFARFFEYTMWVESRRVNWWAVGFGSALVACLAVLLVVSVLRRRSRS